MIISGSAALWARIIGNQVKILDGPATVIRYLLPHIDTGLKPGKSEADDDL